MLIETNPQRTKGLCTLYPESKKERDIIMNLNDSLKPIKRCVEFEFEPDSIAMSLTIYRIDEDPIYIPI